MTVRTIEVALRANVAGFQAQMGAASAQVKAFGTDVGSMLTATDRDTQKAVETVSRGALLMGAGLLAGFGVAVGAAANFQKEMSGVQAVSGATGAEMKLLSEAALKAGADTLFSASEAARGQAELAKAGISTADILGGALTGSLALAAAGQLDVAQAAEISAQAMNIFGLSGSDVGRIADVLAAGAGKSAANVDQMGEALRQGGLVASQTGLTLEETVATLAIFADNALVGSDAGTSLKTMLQRLTPTSKESADMMAQLGFSAYDAQGNFIGMEALAAELQTSLGGLTVEQRNTALATMFGSDAIRGANILYNEGAPGVARWVALVHDQGYAVRTAAELTNNLAGDVERLGGSLETALIRSGSGANTVLREMVQFATGAVNAIGELPAPLLAAGAGFTGISGAALLVLGGVGTLIPKLREVQLALAGMGSTGIATAGILSTIGKAAAIGAGVGLLAMALDQVRRALFDINPDLTKLQQGLLDLQRGGDVGAVMRSLSTDTEGFRQSLALLSGTASGFGATLTRMIDPITFNDNMDDARQRVDGLDQALANLVRTAGPEAAGQAFDDFARSLGLSQAEIDALRPQLDAYNGALDENKLGAEAAAIAQRSAAGATGELGGAMGDTALITEEQKKEFEANAKAAEELAKVHQAYADAAGGFVDPLRAWSSVVEEATTKAREHAEGVAASTEDTKDSWEDYVVEASGSLDAFVEKLQGQIAAQDEWANNLKTIAARGRVDVVDELTLMGEEGAALVAALADAEGEEMNRAADLIVEAGRRGSLEYGTELDIGMKAAAEIVKQGGNATVESVMTALGPMPGLTAELVRSVGQGMGVSLDETRPAWEAAWQGRKTISLAEMNAMLVGAPPLAQQAAQSINQWLIDTHPEFAAQFASRHGVSVEEMRKILADAPPEMLAATNLINQHLINTKPDYDFQWIERRVAAVREMAEAKGLAPPIADETARIVNNALGQHLPGYQFQYGERKNITAHEMGTAAIEAAVKAGAAGDGMNRELGSRLPPFQRTVSLYQDSLTHGIHAVTSATGGAGARRDTGPARPGIAVADGGIIEFYATGGMKEAHQAQIARAGDWRVWAEPETGGEAYIPLALAKRQRSTDILTEVASRFGLVLRPAEEDEVLDYHEGGICGHTGCQHFHSGGLYVPPAHPQFNDYGEPIKPAGAGTTHAMQEMVAARARAHMQEPHHTMPPPMAGGSLAGGGGGGHTLSRARSIIGQFPGARITSTYRTPAQNAAVGGAARSLHMDRANPATDIGGPTGTLDAIHARLRSMGGWRELIWRAPGHYDPVHVAEEGGIFEQSFDSGGYLQPGYTLAYNGTGMPERVLAYAEGGLRGDTFYGDPGGRKAKRQRFSDEDGAQFDYMNRRETRARRHEYLDYGTPHNARDGLRPSDAYLNEWNSVKEMAKREDRMMERLGMMAARSGQATPVMSVPMNQSTDNSVNLSFAGPAVKVEVSAQVGADAGQLRNQVLEAVNQSFGAWTESLTTEIRTRRR